MIADDDKLNVRDDRRMPVIALVGRPNVGKSTLFNQLTRSRDAIVANLPGLTRDRQYGTAEYLGRRFILVDTGGITGEEVGLDQKMAQQSLKAAEEADVVVMLVDARTGLSAADNFVIDNLRNLGKPTVLAANKIDGLNPDVALAEFYSLGLGEVYPIAAAHKRGIRALMKAVFALLPDCVTNASEDTAEDTTNSDASSVEKIRVAIVGRPNVGKSTLVNRMLGEERVVVYDHPGTTRDSIYIDMSRRGQHYTLIDTAGVRRRARVKQSVEKFSVIKTLQAVEDAHVVIFVMDAREGVTEQDLHLLGHVVNAGCSLVIAVNKWDGLDEDQKRAVKDTIDLRLQFVSYAEVKTISALHGTGVGLLFDAVEAAYRSAFVKMTTRTLTEWLQEAQFKHAPPMVRGHRIKLRMAHPGGHNPPLIVVHGNLTNELPLSYQRYLSNFYRAKLGLVGTPIRFEFKSHENPFAGRRNALTERQLKKRRRLIKHVKKRERKRKRS